MPGVWREGARPKSDLADVLMSGVVPNISYLNDGPFPRFFFTLFERNISNGRAGVVQTNQNLFQNPAKAAFLSSNLKCAGLVLGSAHPLMSPSFMSPRLLVSTLVQTETVPKDLKAGPHQRKVPGQLLCMQITLLRSPASP